MWEVRIRAVEGGWMVVFDHATIPRERIFTEWAKVIEAAEDFFEDLHTRNSLPKGSWKGRTNATETPSQ